jgi:hypothetical protein
MSKEDFRISQNHPDLQILCELTKTQPDRIGTSSWASSTNLKGFDCNYMRVNFLKYWTPEDMEEIYEAVKTANEKTTEYRFEIVDFEDYEVEYDNDRTWPASFQFKSIKK